ncbi:hypothetical protein LCM10_05880 [Rossellomorea aquimaris]|uniref:hypothetical protein n=1 Tax=Rossellomorea aquimaris TaxID=189382 RepID=UPI001CD467FF|nr:hypothetical protein [Rossellomorea aquimaris]MCA1054509.1 hypothetical protein [Rossellomorea aquimaris]
MNQLNDQRLLVEYRSIWKNRLLEQDDQAAGNILNEAIRRDLLDENSHPRVRKTIKDKYVMATKRIIESGLSSDSKVQLLQLHVQVMEQLSDRK